MPWVVRRSATDVNLHELRKTVKDLWYRLRLLGGDRPPPIQTLTKRLRDLGRNSAMTTISRCSWRHAPTILCPNLWTGRRLKKQTIYAALGCTGPRFFSRRRP